MTTEGSLTNYIDNIDNKYTNTTLNDNEYISNLNSFSSVTNSIPNNINSNSDSIDQLINDSLTNRKDLIMLLRKRMFNNSDIMNSGYNLTTSLISKKPAHNPDVYNSIDDTNKFDLLDNKESVRHHDVKSPLVIRDLAMRESSCMLNKKMIRNGDIILEINRRELNALQITRSQGNKCWESILLELYNIPFEISDDKLEYLFRRCKYKIISLQREQHLFNRPSNATICISYNTNDLKVLEIANVLASKCILMNIKQIITY